MIATNQNTQFHDVNWTNIAPMTTPRAMRVSARYALLYAPGTSLTISNGATASKHADSARLLPRLGEDVDNQRES